MTTNLKTSNHVLLLLFLGSLIVGCSGGGSGGSSAPGSNNPSTLITSLIRQSGEADNVTQFWRCADKNYVYSYLALNDFDGRNEALWFVGGAPLDEANVPYTWQARSGDEVVLTRANGEQDVLSYIRFSTARSLSMVSQARGYHSCTYHSDSEIQSLNRGEQAPGEVLSAEPMLPVSPPAQFQGLRRYIEYQLFGVGDLRPVNLVAELFDNGQTSLSLNDVFLLGMPAFQPDLYYAIEGEELLLDFDVSMSGPTRHVSSALEPAGSDERLDGCAHIGNNLLNKYLTNMIAPEGTDSGYWCFGPDGLFTLQTEPEPSISVNGFRRTPFNSGSYRLDGHVMRLQFYVGYQVSFAFSWYERDDREIYLMEDYGIKLKEPADLNRACFSGC